MFRPEVKLDADTVPVFLDSLRQYEGSKFFELSNHLGNVLATVSDRRQPKLSVGVVEYYQPVVVLAQDYYPFGMEMPGRSYSLGALYRFGFNGQEEDREWNKTHFRFREYDERSGRMISVDPLTKSYPMFSPYQYASNSPISNIDIEGLEKIYYTFRTDEYGTPHYKVIRQEDIIVSARYSPGGLDQKPIINVELFNPFVVYVNQDLLDAQRQVALNKAIQDRAQRAYASAMAADLQGRFANPIWNIYQLSGFSDGVAILNELNDENYGNAALAASLLFLPKGFKSLGEFRQFGTAMQAGLSRLGYKETKLYMQGSAVTGKSAETGALFDVADIPHKKN